MKAFNLIAASVCIAATVTVVSCAGASSAASTYAPDTSYRPVARPWTASAPVTSLRPVARPARVFEVCMSEGGEVYVVPLPNKDPALALSQCLALLDEESRQ